MDAPEEISSRKKPKLKPRPLAIPNLKKVIF